MKMYRAWAVFGEIVSHDIAKRTEKTVWVLPISNYASRPSQERIESDGVKWCDTWEDAKAFLVSQALDGVKRAADTLTYREEILRRVESLTNPEVTESRF